MAQKFHYAGREPYIYICCSLADAETVSREVAWIILQGYHVYFDAGAEYGEGLPPEVEKAIGSSSQFIAYLSGGMAQSPSLCRQLDLALMRRIPVLPVFLEEVKLSQYYDIMFGTMKCISRPGVSSEAYYHELLQAMNPKCHASGQEEAAPAEKKQPNVQIQRTPARITVRENTVRAEQYREKPAERTAEAEGSGQHQLGSSPKGLYTLPVIVAAVVAVVLICVLVQPIRDTFESFISPQTLYEQYYNRGVGLQKSSPDKAITYFKKSANGGNKKAQFSLAKCYLSGTGIKEDDTQAAKWLQKSADQGYSDAQYLLATLYESGSGVRKDAQSAFNWYSKAAAKGNAAAECKVGEFYRLGNGIEHDYKQSMTWYRKSAALGNADAQNGIGILYRDGLGVGKDTAEALKRFQLAADGGSAEGQDSLGRMYLAGNGIQMDYEKALSLFQTSAKSESQNGEFDYGYLYYAGKGVQKDYTVALEWFKKSAAQGNPKAEYYLGYMYEYGRGVGKDLAKAKQLYESAAASGYSDATHRLTYSKFQ